MPPTLRITGNAPGLPLWFIVAGDMANQFSEKYTVDINAKDTANVGSSTPSMTPHPPDMNFDSGRFESTRFLVELFSGVVVNGSSIFSGADIVRFAETLFKLSLPQYNNNSFNGPPLVTIQYAAFWRAKGLLQNVEIISKGAFDAGNNPTLMTLSFEFARHFGGSSQSQGIYDRAQTEDLRRATAQGFSFLGG